MAVTLDDLGGWRAVLLALTSGRDLTADEGRAAMTEILAGSATDAQIAAYIVALRMKGEAVDEVAGMVEAMLEASDPISIPPGTRRLPRRSDRAGSGSPVRGSSSALSSSTTSAISLPRSPHPT